jgi:hypothetical protein
MDEISLNLIYAYGSTNIDGLRRSYSIFYADGQTYPVKPLSSFNRVKQSHFSWYLRFANIYARSTSVFLFNELICLFLYGVVISNNSLLEHSITL